MSIEKILVVDDEALLRNFLSETLRRKGLDVTTAENGNRALAMLKAHHYDLVITDMKLPDMTGIDVLKKAKELHPGIVVIVITAYGSVENAVEAMRLGAFTYLIKPFSPDTIEAIIDKAKEHIRLKEENSLLRQQISRAGGEHAAPVVIAHSKVMQDILEEVRQVAKSNASVFITGESGTGKEIIAHTIHYNSQRSANPFIKVNCAAIPDTLIESEFFGHEKGAFTGAHIKKLGRLELAHTGTLLLDEITETPPMLQAKLLRVIQEQEFERVGGTKSIHVDVRFISTTNRDIRVAVEKGLLREDLLYRLNVVPIKLPSLRERPEDIIPLADHFIERMCTEYHLQRKELTDAAKNKLMSYHWPGNVRELANVIERAIVLDESTQIKPDHLSMGLPPRAVTPQTAAADLQGKLPVGMTLREIEDMFIIESLSEYKNRRKTAKVLGISERTLRNRLNQLGSSEKGQE